MATQSVEGSGRTLQKQRLDNLNHSILPKFYQLETLKSFLEGTDDVVFIDAIQERIIKIRNGIIEEVIRQTPDFLDALAYSWHNCFSYDEAKSHVYEHLLEAVLRYKTATKPFCKFTSFFWMYNQNIFRNKRKQERAGKRDKTKTNSLDFIVETQPNSFAVEDTSFDNYLKAMHLRKVYNNSTPKQKRVMKRLYLGYSQSEIARILGVTGTNINTIIRKIRENIDLDCGIEQK